MRPSADDAKPPQEVRITELRVEPWPDGRRVRVHLTLTPFLQSPNLSALLMDTDGRELARADIIETADDRIVFTMHIRAPQAEGTYQLSVQINYAEIGLVDQQTTTFSVSPASGGDV